MSEGKSLGRKGRSYVRKVRIMYLTILKIQKNISGGTASLNIEGMRRHVGFTQPALLHTLRNLVGLSENPTNFYFNDVIEKSPYAAGQSEIG